MNICKVYLHKFVFRIACLNVTVSVIEDTFVF